MNSDDTILPGWSRGTAIGLLLIGLFACAATYLLNPGHPERFFQSYLFGYIFWLCLTLGCFFITLGYHSIHANWSRVILRMMEAGTKTLPWLALGWLPLYFGRGYLYPWANPSLIARPYPLEEATQVLTHRSVYLNDTWFLLRAILYFAIWWGASAYLNRSSLRQDRTGDPTLAQKRANLAAPMIVVHFLCVTFAFTDWVMSLDPVWYSTIYGAWFTMTQGLMAVAFGAFLLILWSDRRPFSAVVTPIVTRDLGNMMLAATMFWMYLTLSQYLIIYSGNLPEEVAYFLRRNVGYWQPMGAFLIVFGFFAPFVALFSGRTKRTPGLLMLVAGWTVFVRLIDYGWHIIPSFVPTHYNIWSDLVMVAGVGAIWSTLFIYHLKRHPLLPLHAPRTQEVLEHA